MKNNKFLALSVILVLFLSAAGLTYTNVIAKPSGAATAPGLGAAGAYSLLAGVSASSANSTTLGGSLGVSPGITVTGPYTVGGSTDLGPATNAATAQNDALGAFGNLAGQGSDGTWSLNPNPVPGVWTDASSSTFAGTLTLSGDYTDVWVFQITSDLTFTGSVVMAGNAQACNVYWQIARDATIATGSSFVGTLIASRDVTLVSGATVSGRILSLNGAVTTDNNTITMPPCASAPAATATSGPPVPAATTTSGPSVPSATATSSLPGLVATNTQAAGVNNPQPEGGSTEAAIATVNAITTGTATPRAGVPSTGGAPLQGEGTIWLILGFSGLSVAILFYVTRKINRDNGSKR